MNQYKMWSPGAILYTLTPDELARARRVGDLRQDFHDRRGTPNTYNLGPDAYNDRRINRLGALGELVVATLLGTQDTWVECTDDYHSLTGDVAPGIEVRSSGKTGGDLLLHDRDKPDRAYVHCRHHYDTDGRTPTATEVTGWLLGHEGQHPDFWWEGAHGNRPCYRIHPKHLRPGLRGLHQWISTPPPADR